MWQNSSKSELVKPLRRLTAGSHPTRNANFLGIASLVPTFPSKVSSDSTHQSAKYCRHYCHPVCSILYWSHEGQDSADHQHQEDDTDDTSEAVTPEIIVFDPLSKFVVLFVLGQFPSVCVRIGLLLKLGLLDRECLKSATFTVRDNR